MKEKLINKLYDFWVKDDSERDTLFDEISIEIYENGVEGANTLLDWVRDDYDYVKDEYKRLHNLTDDEMEKLLEEHYGNYDFIKDETDILNRAYIEDLDNIWELLNHYLDYCNGYMTEEEMLRDIEVY